MKHTVSIIDALYIYKIWCAMQSRETWYSIDDSIGIGIALATVLVLLGASIFV